jgi:hypothetical protein
MLFLPGVTPRPALPYMQPGSTPNIAPVVQVQSEAPSHMLVGIFKDGFSEFAKELGKQTATALFQNWG